MEWTVHVLLQIESYSICIHMHLLTVMGRGNLIMNCIKYQKIVFSQNLTDIFLCNFVIYPFYTISYRQKNIYIIGFEPLSSRGGGLSGSTNFFFDVCLPTCELVMEDVHGLCNPKVENQQGQPRMQSELSKVDFFIFLIIINIV